MMVKYEETRGLRSFHWAATLRSITTPVVHLAGALHNASTYVLNEIACTCIALSLQPLKLAAGIGKSKNLRENTCSHMRQRCSHMYLQCSHMVRHFCEDTNNWKHCSCSVYTCIREGQFLYTNKVSRCIINTFFMANLKILELGHWKPLAHFCHCQ